jgi:uncharacterized DUF497 family protein
VTGLSAITCDLTRNPFFSVGSIVTRQSGASLHPLGLTLEDDSSAGASRRITVGMNAGVEVLVVVWTERDDGERLISVRRATAKERKDYES